MVKPRALLSAARRAMAVIVPSRGAPSVAAARKTLLCLWQDEGRVHAAEVADDGKARLVDCSTPGALRARHRSIIAILPKSHYMVKTIVVPQVTPEEVPAMLRLEAEASLPPEFGEAEVSYLQLPPDVAREGRLRFEVYVARDESLRRLAETMDAAGLCPDMILPSVVAWRSILASQSEAGMLVAELPDGQIETAASQDGGGCHVRTIEKQDGHGHAIAPGVVESIRALLASETVNGHHTVLWCGPNQPQSDLGTVRFRNTSSGLAEAVDGVSTLALAWRGISRLPAADLRMASLSPRGQEEGRRRREDVRRIVTGGAALLAGLLLVQVSLWILGARCGSAISDLDQQIARIRREGETAENRLKQLEVMAAARGRQDEFQQLLSAVYEFTPPGISYSEIAMDESGAVNLRGQALSMGQPFLLPGALEGKGSLTHVVVKSAGLSKTGGGTIAEFKAQLTLKREGRRP